MAIVGFGIASHRDGPERASSAEFATFQCVARYVPARGFALK
jgi:hypothetical protein